MKYILCQNKLKLIPNSYPVVYTSNCSCNTEYICETKKKLITRTIEHQQYSIKGKWESLGATEHCLKSDSHLPKKFPLFASIKAL